MVIIDVEIAVPVKNDTEARVLSSSDRCKLALKIRGDSDRSCLELHLHPAKGRCLALNSAGRYPICLVFLRRRTKAGSS